MKYKPFQMTAMMIVLSCLLSVAIVGDGTHLMAATAGTPSAAASGIRIAQTRIIPKPCREVCRNDANCGPITYERRCVNGACFDFPRQHCTPIRVCNTVCG